MGLSWKTVECYCLQASPTILYYHSYRCLCLSHGDEMAAAAPVIISVRQEGGERGKGRFNR